MRAPRLRAWTVAAAFAAAALLAGCVENTAAGNDREAELEPPARAAQLTSAGAATDGVATGLLMPGILTDADRAALPDLGEHCTFRMTRVGMPAFVYGGVGVLKLNGKLVPLDGQGNGRYAAGGVEVTVRPLEDASRDGAQFPAELVLRLPGAPDELGFHGYGEC